MSQDRPEIPSDIKRAVRKRCGGGCVMCGSAIYDYEHVEDYNLVKVHDVDNISLLCPKHHRAKTAGRLDLNYYKKKNLNPVNIQRQNKEKLTGKEAASRENINIVGIDNFIFSFNDSETSCRIIDGHFAPLLCIDINEIIVVSRQDDLMFITVRAYDDKGSLVLHIDRGELLTDLEGWDFEVIGSLAKIRSQKYRIDFEFKFSGSGLHINKGKFHGLHGTSIEFTRSGGATVEQNGYKSKIKNYKAKNAIIILNPALFEVAEFGIDGNIISEKYAIQLYSVMNQIDRHINPLDHQFILSRYINCMLGVARKKKDLQILEGIIPELRASLSFHIEHGNIFQAARDKRGLGRELWRLRKIKTEYLEESVRLLEELDSSNELEGHDAELARLHSNLGDSVAAVYQLTENVADRDRAEHFYNLALGTYRHMELNDAEDSPLIELEAKISALYSPN